MTDSSENISKKETNVRCPFCKQFVNHPDPLKHLIECQKLEAQQWEAHFQASLSALRVKQIDALAAR